MSHSILSRYLDPQTLGRLAQRSLEPRGLVLGHLAGAHKSPLAGFAVEFAGHREYTAGDDLRHLDWRVYYRREKFFIKQYEMETNLTCHLVLDFSESMRYGEGDEQKLLYAQRMAVILAKLITAQSDLVSLAALDESVAFSVPPSNSPAQVVRFAEEVHKLEPRRTTRLEECLQQLVGRWGRREIVMIFSDFLTDLDALETALQRLRFQRHEVVLFHVLHHDELAFQFEGQVRFRGLEGLEELTTQPEELRALYLEALARHNAQLDDICRRNRIERVPIDTSLTTGDVLLDYLNQRSRAVHSRF
ncbi:MAG: DUF58 domain-containing protein [Planctomycetales bacterium]|nr:DUF58 domain-containing protein [Planctomycetales bacterium]MBN8627579.1 DUF58 domain-containing protein [Planctomycetota bacterium]